MPLASYSVVCDLGLENFDRPRAGYRAAKGAFAEVERLARLDHRVRSARMRRRGRRTVSVSLTVRAGAPWEAFDVCSAILRAAIHANGGSTAGWDLLCPQMQPDARRGRAKAPREVPAQAPSSWSGLSAAADRTARTSPPLPPLVASIPDELVVDLR